MTERDRLVSGIIFIIGDNFFCEWQSFRRWNLWAIKVLSSNILSTWFENL